MADMVAADVVYALIDEAIDSGSGYRSSVYTMTFGDGALTYPNAAGGVPLTIANLGCPNYLISLMIMEDHAENGLIYKWDQSAATLLIYNSAAVATNVHTHDIFMNDGAATDGTDTRVVIAAGGTDIGHNHGSDLTVTGVSDGSTLGGIIQSAALTQVAGALAELAGSATPAEAVLRVHARGW